MRIVPEEVKYQKVLRKSDIFWSRVDQSNKDGCWPWLGAIGKNGYGFMNIKPTLIRSHRAAWMLAHGIIPAKKWVLHRCDNPPCCNPAHLFLGDNDANVADMVAKGRQSKGEKNSAAVKKAHDLAKARDPERHHRIYGGPHLGTKNVNAKLTEEDVRAIRKSEGTYKEIAARYGVYFSVIGKIRRREMWTHVSDAPP